MKKLILALMVGTGLFCCSIAYSQDDTKADHKMTKAEKKSNKGKHHKAMKKAYKMDKKMDKDK